MKRILSFVLTLCLILGLLPAVALPEAKAAVETASVYMFGATQTVNAGETLYWADDGTNIPAVVTADDKWNYSFAIVDDIPTVTLRDANYQYSKSFIYRKVDGAFQLKYEGINNIFVPYSSSETRYFINYQSETNATGKGHLYILGAEGAVLNVTGGDNSAAMLGVSNKAYLTISGGTLNMEKTTAGGVYPIIGAGYSKTTIENCTLNVTDTTGVQGR